MRRGRCLERGRTRIRTPHLVTELYAGGGVNENPLSLFTVTSEPNLWEAQGADCCSVHQEAGFPKVDGDILIIHTAHL